MDITKVTGSAAACPTLNTLTSQPDEQSIDGNGSLHGQTVYIAMLQDRFILDGAVIC